ncbi:MAG: rodlin [Pseudonocardiales bacterium]
MHTIGKKIVAVLIPSGVVAALMLGSIGTANAAENPQLGLVHGSFNKPCIALPVKANIQSGLGLVNVGVQDIPVLSNPQQCTENSTQAKGDEPLSHILDNIPVLSGNASAGS